MTMRRAGNRFEVEDFLSAVEARMHVEITHTPAARPARNLVHAGGKRLRARVLWWSAIATAPSELRMPDTSNLVRAAAAIELAHLSSLIHDDIVDRAATRRGVPTLHTALDTDVATDAGAALAHLASGLLAPLGPQARWMVRRAILAICRGQLRELAAAFVKPPLRVRFAIMHEKTATFFELAAGLGARLAGAPRPQRSAVGRFARRWGIAFQIADDVLDLAGDPRELGRTNGADLLDGVLTLPILLATDHDDALGLALGRRGSHDADWVATCADLIERGNGTTRAAAMASWWMERAIAALDVLPATPARAALVDLARVSIRRGLTRGTTAFAASPAPRLELATDVDRTSNETGAPVPLSADPVTAELLSRTLDWMLPGLAATVGMRAGVAASVVDRCERALLRGNPWSGAGRAAARAIALAHVLSHDRTVDPSPIPPLALADCLHCIGIALLCGSTNSGEHERLAERARLLPSHRGGVAVVRPEVRPLSSTVSVSA